MSNKENNTLPRSLSLIFGMAWMVVNCAIVDNSETVVEAGTFQQEEPVRDYEAVDTLFHRFQDDEPGIVAAVYNEGEMVYRHSAGQANMDYGIALSDSSRFYMASLSKQITAAAAAVLIHRDELQMDREVGDVLEEWPEWAEEVQVRHLIHHTSGLPELYDLLEVSSHSLFDPLKLEHYLDIITNAEKLNHAPGAEFQYTNSGYSVLAAVIEKITGQSLDAFAQEALFEPLGMKETHFQMNRTRVIPNRALSYAPHRGGFRQTYRNTFQGYGPGGLYSTIRDWQQWEKLRTGADLFGKEESFRELLHQPGETRENDSRDYAFGVELTRWKGQPQVSHSGSFMGFNHHLRHLPQFGISILVLSNRGDTDAEALTEEIAEHLLTDELVAWLEPYTGTFHNDELDVTYTFTTEDGRLYLDRPFRDQTVVSYEDEDKWSTGSWDFVFERSDNDQAGRFLLSTGRARDVEFVRVEEKGN